MKKIAILSILCLGFGWVGAYAANDQTTTNSDNNGAQMQTQTGDAKSLGQAYLANNKLKPGVVTLPSGLQYKIITKGAGPKPKATDEVTVNYAGTLIDGTEFDSSYKRGEPATFPVNGVIPGWVEALQLMPEGSTWELYIPAALAYGDQGAPPSIGPNETLIFKVNLIKVNHQG